jgi:hypothetical protein
VNRPNRPPSSMRHPAEPPLSVAGLQATFEALSALSMLFSALREKPPHP